MMKTMQRTLRCLGAAFGITAALLASACGGGGGSSNGGGGGGGGTPPLGSLQLVTLSNRADLVSDGDVLMAVSSTAGLTGLAVDVDGQLVHFGHAGQPMSVGGSAAQATPVSSKRSIHSCETRMRQ